MLTINIAHIANIAHSAHIGPPVELADGRHKVGDAEAWLSASVGSSLVYSSPHSPPSPR